jgi:hypothetical protein
MLPRVTFAFVNEVCCFSPQLAIIAMAVRAMSPVLTNDFILLVFFSFA